MTYVLDDQHLIDFNSARELVNTYLGNAFKMKVSYEGSVYVLKFGCPIEPGRFGEVGSYENSPLSEYLGSHVFTCCGIEAQSTYLGEYHGRLVVACRDFTDGTSVPTTLIEFKSLENSFVDGSTSSPGRTPSLEDVESILETHPYLEPIREEAIRRFRETVCVDALIGNFDRHASNWGYLLDGRTGSLYKCAPVYDCASSLSQKLSETKMATALSSRAYMDVIALRPKAALTVGGRKLSYPDLLQGPCASWSKDAFTKVLARLDVERLRSVILHMPGTSPVRRQFYEKLLDRRVELLADAVIDGGHAIARENPRLEERLCDPTPSWCPTEQRDDATPYR